MVRKDAWSEALLKYVSCRVEGIGKCGVLVFV